MQMCSLGIWDSTSIKTQIPQSQGSTVFIEIASSYFRILDSAKLYLDEVVASFNL